MPDTWSIEQELCKSAGKNNLIASLVKLGLLANNDTFHSIIVDKDWHRSGAETYLLKFTVRGASQSTVAILKAYTPTSPAAALLEQFDVITSRRKLLAAVGVPTPHLYHAGNGIWIEDWIEDTIDDAIKEIRHDDAKVVEVSRKLYDIAYALDQLGFSPMRVYSDLRSRNGAPIMIDFGSDLGAPNRMIAATHNRFQLLEWARRCCPEISASVESIVNRSSSLPGSA